MHNEEQNGSTLREKLKERVDIIEETYDAMLAYAAQGQTGTEPAGTVSELRNLLEHIDGALLELVPLLKELTAAHTPKEAYDAFIEVLDKDARAARAGIQLALAQQSISSQLIDNLNAWIHLRALLTDLFIIDEILTRD
jgi:hypothetical protein